MKNLWLIIVLLILSFLAVYNIGTHFNINFVVNTPISSPKFILIHKSMVLYCTALNSDNCVPCELHKEELPSTWACNDTYVILGE